MDKSWHCDFAARRHAHFAICSQPWLSSFNLMTSILLHYQLLTRDSAPTSLRVGSTPSGRSLGDLLMRRWGSRYTPYRPAEGDTGPPIGDIGTKPKEGRFGEDGLLRVDGLVGVDGLGE